MATYEEIYGKRVEVLDTDPDNSAAEGQVWYNSASGTLKAVVGIEAWASTAPGIYTKNTAGGAGTTTAAVVYGGASSSGTVYHNETVEYDGSNFTVTGNLGTARQDGGSCGTQTAALFVGGEASTGNVADTEEYNGSTWSEETNIPTSDRGWGSFGLQTAAVMVGGATAPTTKCFEYDGSSWTTSGALTDGRRLSGMGCGTETAGLVAGGDPNSNKTETYNGSAWTAGNTLNTGRQQGKMSGPQTAGLVWGGETPSLTTATEKFDGTSWTASPATLGTAVKNNAGNKDTTSGASALNVYGNTPGDTSSAEEYNSGVNVITAAAWASGPNMGTGRASVKGAGTQLAAWALGGETAPGPTVNSTENFDGSSWTAGGAFPATTRSAFTCGTQTAGLGAGGNSAPGQTPYNTASAEYDGSSWTASPGALSPAKGYGAMSGVQTTALATGGDGPSNPSHPFAQVGVQSYNGSSWSSETNYPTTFYGGTGAGISETAAVVWGGSAPYPGTNPSTADYNGSSWTLVATTITNAGAPSTNGCQGTNQSPAASCGSMGGTSGGTGYFQWNDTAWSTMPNMGTGGDRGGAGTLTAAIAFGGYHPGEPRMNDTEEFTAETSAVNVKTLTTS